MPGIVMGASSPRPTPDFPFARNYLDFAIVVRWEVICVGIAFRQKNFEYQ